MTVMMGQKTTLGKNNIEYNFEEIISLKVKISLPLEYLCTYFQGIRPYLLYSTNTAYKYTNILFLVRLLQISVIASLKLHVCPNQMGRLTHKREYRYKSHIIDRIFCKHRKTLMVLCLHLVNTVPYKDSNTFLVFLTS